MVSVLASRVVDRGFIGDVMVSVLASRVVDRGFESRSGQTKHLFVLLAASPIARSIKEKEQVLVSWESG